MKKDFDTYYKLNQKIFRLKRDSHWNKIMHELVGKKLSKVNKI